MIIRNYTSDVMKVMIDPSEYLRRTNVTDFQKHFSIELVLLRYSEGSIVLSIKYTDIIADNH